MQRASQASLARTRSSAVLRRLLDDDHPPKSGTLSAPSTEVSQHASSMKLADQLACIVLSHESFDSPPEQHISSPAPDTPLTLTNPPDSTLSAPESPPSALEYQSSRHQAILLHSPHVPCAEVVPLIRDYLTHLPPLPSSTSTLHARADNLNEIVRHIDPKRGWSSLRKDFLSAFHAVWGEYFRTLERLRDLGGSRRPSLREGKTGGYWLERDLKTQDFDAIILCLIHAHPPAKRGGEQWDTLSITKVVEFLASTDVAPSARQLHLLLQYYTLDSIFRPQRREGPAVVREVRRMHPTPPEQLVKSALEMWARRRRLSRRVETLVRGVRPDDDASDPFERWLDQSQECLREDPAHVEDLQMTLGETTLVCLEEAVRLEPLVRQGSGLLLERADLDDGLRYWVHRRDAMVKDWREALVVEGGIVGAWQRVVNGTSDSGEVFRPSAKEEDLIILLVRDSLLGNLRCKLPQTLDEDAARLDNPLDLVQLLLGFASSSSQVTSPSASSFTTLPAISDRIGGVLIRARNAFYHQRRFSDLLSLVRLLAPSAPHPSSTIRICGLPAPRLSGPVLASFLCAARNDEQLALLLKALVKLPPPTSPASIDAQSRRMLYYLADSTTTAGIEVEEGYEDGFRGMLSKLFENWGTGLPGSVYAKRENASAGADLQEIEGRYRKKVRVPKSLGQVTQGSHLEWGMGRRRG